MVFIGPPGSGKGSLSELCVKKLGWVQLSTGNLCRKHIAEQTDIGKQIDFAIKSGKLVSDSLITVMVADWFAENVGNAETVILDGFPRTVAQADALQNILNERFLGVNLHVIRLKISDTRVVERLCNRYTCSNKACQAVYSLISNSTMAPKSGMVCDACSCPLIRRADDEEEAIKNRLQVYHKHEQGLLAFYDGIRQPIKQFSVEKSIEDVFEDFTSIFNHDDR